MKKIHVLPALGISQFFQLPFNVKLTCILPFFWLRCYLYTLGMLYFSTKVKDSIRMLACLHFVMGGRATSLNFYWSALKTFCGIFEHYLEKLIMAHRPFSEMIDFLRPRLYIYNKRYLDALAASGSGGIIVTGHFGAVEYLPLSLALNGYKVAMIVRFKTEALRRELMKRASQVDVVLIDADGPKVAFKALEVIKEGRLLITECDEFSEWRPHKECKVPVFGHKVSRDKTLDFFYRRAKVPALLALMKREKGGFSLSIDPLADGKEKVSLSHKAWTCLERHILEAPDQWYQWKDAAIVLEGFISRGNKDEDKKVQHLSAGDTIFAAN